MPPVHTGGLVFAVSALFLIECYLDILMRRKTGLLFKTGTAFSPLDMAQLAPSKDPAFVIVFEMNGNWCRDSSAHWCTQGRLVSPHPVSFTPIKNKGGFETMSYSHCR